MFKHLVLITIRSFKKHRSSFLINILGLSTGLACVLVIFLWVNNERSIDGFHEKGEQIYQVLNTYEPQNEKLTSEGTPLLLPEAMVAEFPEVLEATATNGDFATPEGIFSHGTNTQVAKGLFAAPNFFNVFSFELLLGDSQQVLSDKNNVVISADIAEKLFGSHENAIGKALNWNYQWDDGVEEVDVVVSGVFKDISKNSTLQFDVVAHSDLLIEADYWAGDWSGHYAKTYLVLKEGTDIEVFNKKISKFLTTKIKNREKFTLFVQKFDQRYLKNPYENGVQAGGRIVYVRLFIIIALFILLIACINFMNLSTARASKRMKEIGVKKVLGANRRTLIIQFLGESIAMTCISLGIAFLILIFILPQFNIITGKELSLDFNLEFIASIIILVILTGFLAGSYPAFYLSRFKPASTLKGKLTPLTGEVWARKGLVVFQFSLSVIFILGVFVIRDQMNYLMQKNLGYERDNVITFQIQSNNDKPEVFLSELKKIPAVQEVSFMNGSPLIRYDNQAGYYWGRELSDKAILFDSPRIGYDVIETLGIKIKEGRSFSKEFQDDHHRIVINESAAELMNLENPIGTIIDHGDNKKEIIGVVEDFQYGSLHKKVTPLILRFRSHGRDVLLKMKTGTEKSAIAQIQKRYQEFQPGYPFDFSFLDADYEKLYKAEDRMSVLSNYFALLALLISCLGLFGLATFTAENRVKEIGIRKILGSSVFGIVKMLSSEFAKMVAIAIGIALPIGYLASSFWLEGFAHSIALKWWFFALAGLCTLFIALLTIGWQSYKSASANPVKSLRTE